MHRLSAYVIVHQTQTNQTPNAIRSDTERNPIRQRTQSNQTADGNQSDGGRNHQGVQLSQLHQQSKQSKDCTNKANRARTAPTKPTELSFHEPQPDPRPARYHAPRSHEQPIAPIDGHYLLATLHRIHDVRSHMLR